MLVFSFVGMKKQEIPVSGKEFIEVVLEEDNENLDDVVVTGYQTISRNGQRVLTRSWMRKHWGGNRHPILRKH